VLTIQHQNINVNTLQSATKKSIKIVWAVVFALYLGIQSNCIPKKDLKISATYIHEILKKYITAILVISPVGHLFPTIPPSGVLSLSELDVEKPEQPWWSAQKNLAINGMPIRM